MDLGPLVELATELQFELQARAVDITVTLPEAMPVENRGIWMTPAEPEVQIGVDYQRRRPRRVMALLNSVFPQVPTGTLILAPEKTDAVPKVWRVDGVERREPEHIRVTVVETDEVYG